MKNCCATLKCVELTNGDLNGELKVLIKEKDKLVLTHVSIENLKQTNHYLVLKVKKYALRLKQNFRVELQNWKLS